MCEKSRIFAAESCQSGRSGQTRNLLNPSGFRGFESLTFRVQKGRQNAALFAFRRAVARLRAKGVAECKKPLRSNALFRMQGRPRRRKGYTIPLPACEQKAWRNAKSHCAAMPFFACRDARGGGRDIQSRCPQASKRCGGMQKAIAQQCPWPPPKGEEAKFFDIAKKIVFLPKF